MKTYLIPTTQVGIMTSCSLLAGSGSPVDPPRVTGEFLQGGDESGNAGNGW